jgi:hypothetical protein
MNQHNFKPISLKDVNELTNHNWGRGFIYKICENCKLLCAHDNYSGDIVIDDWFRLNPVSIYNYRAADYLSDRIKSVASYTISDNLLSCDEELIKGIL